MSVNKWFPLKVKKSKEVTSLMGNNIWKLEFQLAVYMTTGERFCIIIKNLNGVVVKTFWVTLKFHSCRPKSYKCVA